MKITESQLRRLIQKEIRTVSPRGDKLAQAIAIVSLMDVPENPFQAEIANLNAVLQDLLDAQDSDSAGWFG